MNSDLRNIIKNYGENRLLLEKGDDINTLTGWDRLWDDISPYLLNDSKIAALFNLAGTVKLYLANETADGIDYEPINGIDYEIILD